MSNFSEAFPGRLLPEGRAEGDGSMAVPRLRGPLERPWMGTTLHTYCVSHFTPSTAPASESSLRALLSQVSEQAPDDSRPPPVSHTTDVRRNRDARCLLGRAQTAGFCEQNKLPLASAPLGLICYAAFDNHRTPGSAPQHLQAAP